MGGVVRFPGTEQMRDRYGSLAGPRVAAPSGWSRRLGAMLRNRIVAVLFWSVVAIGCLAAHRASDGRPIEVVSAGVVAFFSETPPASVPAPRDAVVASFAYCGEGTRDDCVLDGDTFRFRGARIRVADIDTPELSPPRCEHERRLGEAARRRLHALLNAGPFSLASIDRDEDRYGRKLRIVTRAGRSLGEDLIAEGLARRWDGARRSWCG